MDDSQLAWRLSFRQQLAVFLNRLSHPILIIRPDHHIRCVILSILSEVLTLQMQQWGKFYVFSFKKALECNSNADLLP